MAALSDFLENKLIDWLLRAQAIGIAGASAAAGTGPVTTWVGLYTVSPADAAGGTEVTGGSYARVAITSALANWAGTQAAASTTASSGTSGTTSNNGVVTFPAPTANWGVVVAMGLFDAVTAGNLLIYGAVTPNKTINNGDPAPTYPISALSIQLDN